MTSLDLQVGAPEYLELPGYRMAYRQWGDTSATAAVVLIHGITSSSLSWIRVGPRLAHRWRVIAVDLKGHGDSEAPPSDHSLAPPSAASPTRSGTESPTQPSTRAGGYRLQDQADEVAALCNTLGLEHITLIGHSWGGGISLVLAARNQLPIDRLILEDPAISVGSGSSDQRQQVMDMYVSSVGLTPAEAEARVRANAAPGWTEQDILGKIDASVKTSPDSVRSVFYANGPWNNADLLTKLRMPTLLLRAETSSGGIVPEPLVAVARANPLIDVVTVPMADHNIHRGQFDAFIQHVEAFLARA